jgi:hypothetical protein
VERHIIGLAHALMTEDVHFLALQLLWNLILGLFNRLLNKAFLPGAHFSKALPAHWTVYIGLNILLKTMIVYEMATFHRDTVLCRVLQILEANRAIRLYFLFFTYVFIISGNVHTITAGMAMFILILFAPTTHTTVVLNGSI